MGKEFFKNILLYIIFAVVCIITNLIYGNFSHNVSSNYMTWMFLYPFVLGIISTFLNYKGNKVVKDLFFFGILTLTIGSFLKGVFEIAGTASAFQFVYYVFGIGLLIAGFLYTIFKIIKN